MEQSWHRGLHSHSQEWRLPDPSCIMLIKFYWPECHEFL